MSGVAPQWRYFLKFRTADENIPDEAADAGRAAMYRLPAGAPVSLLEALSGVEGDWQPSDLMWRAEYLGSDYEFTEITPERARQLQERWVAIGRLRAVPSDEPTMSPELAAYLAGLDTQARAAWEGVPKPPGAEDVRG